MPVRAVAAADGAVVRHAIDTSWAEAATSGVRGRAVTPPFSCAVWQSFQRGGFLAANVALVKKNAAVAGRLVVAYAPARRSAAGAWVGVPALSSVALPLALEVGVPAGKVTGAAAVDAGVGVGIGGGGGG